jgi:O-methyltransferase
MLVAPKQLLRNSLQAAARSFGFELRRIPRIDHQLSSLVPDVPHEVIRTFATYAPWLVDEEFRAAYDAVRDFTLVDAYRCYELWSLAGRIAQLGGDAIEIGVWRGGTGALIARRIMSVAPDRMIYLCDTFTGVTGSGRYDTRYRGGEHADTSSKVVRDLLSRMELRNARVLVGVFPQETAQNVTADKLSLVHIDVDVHDSAKWCFEWAWPRLVSGGVIIFDDYGFRGCEGVTRMVNAIAKSDALIIYNLNGHAIVAKT